MSSKGRGSAIFAAAKMLVLVLVLLVEYQPTEAATYTVGGANGWRLNVVDWPKGKLFRAGDILVFNYNPALHNVVVVNKAGYDKCSAPSGAKVYRTGKDVIKIAKGQNFFICTIPGHCQSEMKIAVNAV